MEGRISMSIKELTRLNELTKVHEKKQTIIQTAKNLNLSTRQVLRLSKAFKFYGPKGLVSKKIGAKGNHRLPEELKETSLRLIMEHYSDFGPTLAHEYIIEKHELKISVSSVRNLMIEKQIWIPKKIRKKRIFQLRPRKSCEGELIQVDGSDDDWFEGRAPRCTLLAYIDDATGKNMHLKFVRSENLIDYFIATREYVEKNGRPLAFYSDKHGVFRINRENALTGTGMTQFGRAMQELDIKLICANTPQAKGRVERRNRALQDRLKKALRLHKMVTMECANSFLSTFIEDFNKRFAKPPKDPVNAHRPTLVDQDLNRIFCTKTERLLSKNLILQYNNVIYQIISDKQEYALRKAHVTVLESINGEVTIEYRGKKLTAVPYHQMQARAEVVSSKELLTKLLENKKPYKPGPNHPWKRRRRTLFKKEDLNPVCCY